MTRKDYILIAGAVNEARDQYYRALETATLDRVANAIANSLALDNPAFDRERFLKACGVMADGVGV